MATVVPDSAEIDRGAPSAVDEYRLGEAPDEPGHDATARRRWLMFVVGLLPLVALWSVTNPMLASPDETTHVVQGSGDRSW